MASDGLRIKIQELLITLGGESTLGHMPVFQCKWLFTVREQKCEFVISTSLAHSTLSQHLVGI